MDGKRKGLLVTNAFLRTEKFCEHYEWLKKAAEKRNITLDMTENASLYSMGIALETAAAGVPFSRMKSPDRLQGYQFIIYWDKDIPYGKMLEAYARQHGIAVFNPIDSIAACDDKFETYLRLDAWNREHPEERLALIPTVMAPMTYENIGYPRTDFLDMIEESLGYPVVVKECFGSFGMQVYLAENRAELQAWTRKLAGKPFLYQKYIACSSGRDVRLQVVGSRVVAAMERVSAQGDFRANITNGGSMKPYEPSEKERQTALTACRALGADFAGVDLLFSEEGGQAEIVCEVNSNAHFKNIHACTGVDVAEKIMEYIA